MRRRRPEDEAARPQPFTRPRGASPADAWAAYAEWLDALIAWEGSDPRRIDYGAWVRLAGDRVDAPFDVSQI